MFFFDFKYLLFIAPALLLALWAQYRIKSAYAAAQQQPSSMSGAAAARRLLDHAGLQHVGIEQIPGHLTDHYDPSHKVLRLSPDVYQGRSTAAVGIAAHEAGHAIQDAERYAPLVIRNAAVPVASFGGNFSMIMFFIGIMFSLPMLVTIGILLFSGVVFFQLVNLPVEFNASTRAKEHLVALGVIDEQQLYYVRKVLSAAALTYVAGTLQAIMTLLYLLSRRD